MTALVYISVRAKRGGTYDREVLDFGRCPMFVLTFLLSFVVHGFLLHSDYVKMLSWMRKPEEAPIH